MSIAYNKIEVRVSLEAIRANYRMMRTHGSHVIAVVKADAYGHGLVPVAKALAEEGCDTFAVGTVEEGAALRRELVKSGISARIMSLVGPVDPEDFSLLWEYDIIPLIGGFGQMEALADEAAKRNAPVSVSLKFDTGMARLGFVQDDIPRLLDRLGEAPLVRPVMATSHLATADMPDAADFVMQQEECFSAILAALSAGGVTLEANLANTAAILGYPGLRHESQRAGIALYGANPFAGTSMERLGRGLAPAMEVRTKIVAVHPLKKGQSISYGRLFTAPEDMRVAIVAAGYADGYSRGLTGRGAQMLIGGRRAPLLGRICMQLTAVDVTDISGVQPGDWAVLLGGEGPSAITADELAGWWGTISYEVFCLLGLNRRIYI